MPLSESEIGELEARMAEGWEVDKGSARMLIDEVKAWRADWYRRARRMFGEEER